jgi:hypothetical protein
MQKALSELSSLPEAELVRLFEREPQFVAQSLDSFDSMVRCLRLLESTSAQTQRRRGKLILLRP